MSMRVGKERIIFGSSSLLVSLGITEKLLCCLLNKHHGKHTDKMRAGTQNAHSVPRQRTHVDGGSKYMKEWTEFM